MLQELLDIAADAYGCSNINDAVFVAQCLRRLNVPSNLAENPRAPAGSSLKTALADAGCYPPVRGLEPVMQGLSWVKSGENRHIPANFTGTYHFAMIVGPDASIECPDIRFGLFLQEPHSVYPSHQHAAQEFYFPLSGTALWQKDTDEFRPVAPGTLIHHAPNQPHATTTDRAPLLAFWAWTGDLAVETYRFATP